MCRNCVSPEMADKIELAEDDSLPDGAYFARCAEMGIEVEDLEAYYDRHGKQDQSTDLSKGRG